MAMALLILGVVLLVLLLPVIALVRTARIRDLERRVAALEAALRPPIAPPVLAAAAPGAEPPAPPPIPPPAGPEPKPEPAGEPIEVLIGRRWIAIVAIALIVGAVTYFLKYAFENGWIGELGRVALGVITGLVIVFVGRQRYRAGWRYLSQILIGGGVIVLYLSIYGAFAYYHLINQTSAFLILAIIVAEAALLALAYDAPAIGILALTGGFLVPILLSSGHDQYKTLFTYIALLDTGMLALVLARRWRGLGSIAYLGTQLLFWAWYAEHYHPEKRLAVLVFQSFVFVLFVVVDFRAANIEQLIRAVVNPLAFFAIAYQLLEPDHPRWMGLLAVALAIVYAAIARAQLSLRPLPLRPLLVALGTSMTFIAIAIPVQLDANWITIAWAAQGLVLLWASFETPAPPLRWFAAVAWMLAIIRFLAYDTIENHVDPAMPVVNAYFLGMLALAATLAASAYLYRRTRTWISIALLAFVVFWLGSSVDVYGWFIAQAGRADPDSARHLRWGGQLALSLLWSTYAGLLTAAGFHYRRRALRLAGLALFAFTLLKVGAIDISDLDQFYRIVALLALGLILLAVAWAYQRIPRTEESS